MAQRPKPNRSQLYAWWYLCIGAGFLLLGFRYLLLGDRWPLVILRWAISAGFFALSYFEFRRGR